MLTGSAMPLLREVRRSLLSGHQRPGVLVPPEPPGVAPEALVDGIDTPLSFEGYAARLSGRRSQSARRQRALMMEYLPMAGRGAPPQRGPVGSPAIVFGRVFQHDQAVGQEP